jgi:DHA3 family macrolide efflux protein-like MFS transporter
MTPGSSLASLFGGLVGTGPGAGMSLIFVITGVLGMLVGFGGYAFSVVRNVESILPDHDMGSSRSENDLAH